MSPSANAGTPPVIPPRLPAPAKRGLGPAGIIAICAGALLLLFLMGAVVVAGFWGFRIASQSPPPTLGERQAPARPAPPPPARTHQPSGMAPAVNANAREFSPTSVTSEPGLTYKNDVMPNEPWSIHYVKIDRSRKDIGFFSAHAMNKVLSVSLLAEQARSVPGEVGRALAAINGDFYVRDQPTYAGDPRGLQIVNGELLSAPDTVCVWFDADENPHLDEVRGTFYVTWPDGRKTPFGLNQERQPGKAVLYTPTLGTGTRTSGGRELILEPDSDSPWLPLRAGESYRARVREVTTTGNTRIPTNAMILSLGPQLLGDLGEIKAGLTLQLSTATTPDLKGVKTAIAGGPALIRNGNPFSQMTPPPEATRNYTEASKYQRHPRSAIGWSATHFYFVVVDGRQPGLSMGMKLAELAHYMAGLGCTEAMNLDGGKSSQLWVNGQILNSPCQGEDTVANSLLVVRKPAAH